MQTYCNNGKYARSGIYEGSVNDNTPCHPTTPYGIGKECIKRFIEYDMQTKIMLCFNG